VDRKTEDKWIERWNAERAFEAELDSSREKKLVTFPFPYMNGPLHIGHAFTSTRVDVYARFKRMQGYDVLFPWAWHWTGQPIVSAAERLSKGDRAMIREFVEIDKVPPGELSKFYDPKYMAEYYTNSGRAALKRLAMSIDWRREFHTTDLEPTFNKFVLWQYDKLRQKGYVTSGTHPVVWCPRDQSPTGDHDRIEGEGVTWEEYTLVLFKLVEGESDVFLPAATFRPETIFGVTNLWLNPQSEYVEISVDQKQRWIVSPQAAEKLANQLRKITVLRRFLGNELIGRHATGPLDGSRKLPILPAEFVSPKNGTGVVYSVPAHAPMDYVALRDLQQVPTKLGDLKNEVVAIRPISLISIPGAGEFPAREIVEEMKIGDQSDPKVEDATNAIYKKEFHLGVLNRNTGEYEGKRVSEAKPLIIEKLKKIGLADSMYDLGGRVVCRCLTECIVKVLQDQWFLKYSDPEWKKLAHQCVDSASICPESARQWFHDVIDWLKDWPCARRVGLGTPLPWSPGWIVETLSDSTIYMAFYTIRVALNKYEIDAKQLKGSLFDYVFLGEGKIDSVASECGIPKDQVDSMRKEFLYWYPVNLRNSAKELIPNHLTFFVFQHVAFFPKELWPTMISANGMMMVEGEKMSKSKGNVITLSDGLEVFGADTLRAALMDGAEGMDDLDWREKNAKDLQMKINSLSSFLRNLMSEASSNDDTRSMAEMWLENQIQKRVEAVVSALEVMKTKTAFQEAFYGYWNDLRYYLSRTEIRPAWLVEFAVDTWTRLLAPFLPYSAEELNESRGSKELVSLAGFPSFDETKLHPEAEIGETMIQRLVEDVKKIQKLIQQPAKSVHVYIAPSWGYDLFIAASQARTTGKKTSDTLQQFFQSHPLEDRKQVANALPKISKELNELGEQFVNDLKNCSGQVNEKKVYAEASAYIERQLGLKLETHAWDEEGKYDPKNRSAQALPFKPALFLE
jgi:leucyl-tRNA synthetase